MRPLFLPLGMKKIFRRFHDLVNEKMFALKLYQVSGIYWELLAFISATPSYESSAYSRRAIFTANITVTEIVHINVHVTCL